VNASRWRAEGAGIGPLDDVTVLVIAGEVPTAIAAVARGAAASVRAGRRVAVFDIAGAFGSDDADGLIAAFRQGRSLNALARPLDDGENERFIVPRGQGELSESLVTDPRWPRLIEGFRAAGALLLITVPLEFRGARGFAHLADRAFRLGIRDGEPRLLPYPRTPDRVPDSDPLADDGDDREEGPPALEAVAVPVEIAHVPEGSGRRTPTFVVTPSRGVGIIPQRPAVRWVMVIVGLAVVATAGGWIWRARQAPPQKQVAAAERDSLTAIDTLPGLSADTLVVPDVVNPEDSSVAAGWGVELVATNDRGDANLRLAELTTLKAGTISPVLLGDDSAPWYKLIGGAYVDRTAAELFRHALRQVGQLEQEQGVVTHVPYAIRLDRSLLPDEGERKTAAYATRGVAAYALQQDDGRLTIYAGAFATPEQSVLLYAQLRAAGLSPELAFRVGRTY
jgi:hypothetical protein